MADQIYRSLLRKLRTGQSTVKHGGMFSVNIHGISQTLSNIEFHSDANIVLSDKSMKTFRNHRSKPGIGKVWPAGQTHSTALR